MSAPATGNRDMPPKDVWLEMDPGHDDAIALMFALFALSPLSSPLGSTAQSNSGENSDKGAAKALNLLGVSTTHGNASQACTFVNAARLLAFFGASEACPEHKDVNQGVHLLMGAARPVVKECRVDEGIHGVDGLGGVVGLPPLEDKGVQRRLWAHYGGLQRKTVLSEQAGKEVMLPPHDPTPFHLFLPSLLLYRLAQGLPKLTIIATGPLTNIALLLVSHPTLASQTIAEVVLMGGAPPGTAGNRGPLAEFNILVDPEAAKVVFDSPIPTVMLGLNVTHQAIFTEELFTRLSQPPPSKPEADLIGKSVTFRQTILSLLTFFKQTYADVFSFHSGPPIHDCLAVAYVIDPSLFFYHQPSPSPLETGQAEKKSLQPKRYHVDVECSAGSLALGATVFDPYSPLGSSSSSKPHDKRDKKQEEEGEEEEEEEDWSSQSPSGNVLVVQSVDLVRLWDLFFQCVHSAEDKRRRSTFGVNRQNEVWHDG